MKIVVFEGEDGAGKTTIISELRKRIKCEHPIFIDRFIHSNYVYETLKGNVNIKELELICNTVSKLDIHVFYITIPVAIALKRLSLKPGHEQFTEDLLYKQKNLFNEAFMRLPLPLTIIDGTRPLDEEINFIMEHI